MTNGSLMKVESIAEFPMEHSAILLTCIKGYLVLKKTIFGLFESGRFTQVLLYDEMKKNDPDSQSERTTCKENLMRLHVCAF